MNHYFNEIEAELRSLSGDSPIERQAKEVSNALFKICQDYLWLNTVNRKIESARKVLQNYLYKEECLTYSEKKNNKTRISSEHPRSLDIISKLYIEFFWETYKQKALEEKEFFKDDEEKFLKKIEKEFFKGIENNFDRIFKNAFGASNNMKELKDDIEESIETLKNNYEYIIFLKRLENLNLDNLHRAMKILEDGVKLPKNSLADSVEEILTPEILTHMLIYLKNKDYLKYIFKVAAINQALWSGEPKSYVGKFFNKNNVGNLCNKNYEYNGKHLKKYFGNLEELYDIYTKTRSTIQDYKEKIKQPR